MQIDNIVYVYSCMIILNMYSRIVFSGGAIDWPNEMNTKCREGGACGASGIINWFAWFSVKSSLDLFIIFPLRNCHEDLGFLYPSYPEGRTYHWLDTGKKSPQWRRRSAAGLDLSGIFGRMSWTQVHAASFPSLYDLYFDARWNLSRDVMRIQT